MVGQILADRGHAFVAAIVIPELDLGGVVEIENARQIGVHGQHRQFALTRVLCHFPEEMRRRDLIRHHQQGSFGDELARGQDRKAVRPLPRRVVEEDQFGQVAFRPFHDLDFPAYALGVESQRDPDAPDADAGQDA